MWTELKNQQIKSTDLLRFTYSTIGIVWIQAGELALIEKRLTAKGFRVKSTESIGNKLIVEAYYDPQPEKSDNVQKASVVNAAIIVSICAAVVGGVLWLVMDKSEVWIADVSEAAQEVISTPAGKVVGIGGGVLLGALGIYLLYKMLRK